MTYSWNQNDIQIKQLLRFLGDWAQGFFVEGTRGGVWLLAMSLVIHDDFFRAKNNTHTQQPVYKYTIDHASFRIPATVDVFFSLPFSCRGAM